MSLEISQETQARLAGEARKEGVSVDALLQRLMDEHKDSAGGNGPAPTPGTVPQERPIWEIIAQNMSDVPDDEFRKLPPASQIDHYLYGHPK